MTFLIIFNLGANLVKEKDGKVAEANNLETQEKVAEKEVAGKEVAEKEPAGKEGEEQTQEKDVERDAVEKRKRGEVVVVEKVEGRLIQEGWGSHERGVEVGRSTGGRRKGVEVGINKRSNHNPLRRRRGEQERLHLLPLRRREGGVQVLYLKNIGGEGEEHHLRKRGEDRHL